MSRDEKNTSIEEHMLHSIRERGRGAVFVPSDFLHLGSRGAVDIVLHRLVKRGEIRRLARGIYDYPQEHPVLGTLMPSAETIAQALAGRDRARLQPAGALAANLLGLTEQVPAKAVFLTDGFSRTVKVGPMTIQLRQTTPKNMATAGHLSGLLIQAFRELGKEHISEERIEHLRSTIPLKDRRGILKDINLAPSWMHPIFRRLAEEEE